MENPGVEPGAPILQGSAAARCLPRAWSWFRATLSAFSARRFHQISLPGGLVRMPVIETGPDEWRSSARPSSYTRRSVSGKSDGVFRNTRQVKCELVGSGRNRTSCPKGLRLQRSDGTSLSLFALPDRSPCGRRDRSRTDLEQLMRLPRSRTALQKIGGRLSARCPYACAYQSLSRRCRRLAG